MGWSFSEKCKEFHRRSQRRIQSSIQVRGRGYSSIFHIVELFSTYVLLPPRLNKKSYSWLVSFIFEGVSPPTLDPPCFVAGLNCHNNVRSLKFIIWGTWACIRWIEKGLKDKASWHLNNFFNLVQRIKNISKNISDLDLL